MSDGQSNYPTPRYIRTIFHLGLFGLLSLLFARVQYPDNTIILGLKIFLAAILPYYPAIWASRIRSRVAVIALLIVVIAANMYLLYVEINPNL